MYTKEFHSILNKVKTTHPDLNEDEQFALAERFWNLGKLMIQIWIKLQPKNTKDPPS